MRGGTHTHSRSRPQSGKILEGGEWGTRDGRRKKGPRCGGVDNFALLDRLKLGLRDKKRNSQKQLTKEKKLRGEELEKAARVRQSSPTDEKQRKTFQY